MFDRSVVSNKLGRQFRGTASGAPGEELANQNFGGVFICTGCVVRLHERKNCTGKDLDVGKQEKMG